MTEHSELLGQFRESDELAEEFRMHCKKILAISMSTYMGCVRIQGNVHMTSGDMFV